MCHDLLDALKPLQDELGFRVTVVDVDAHEALEARWSEWGPVVLDGDTAVSYTHLDVYKRQPLSCVKSRWRLYAQIVIFLC